MKRAGPRKGRPSEADLRRREGEGEGPWYADGLRFTCTRCGTCCKGPDPGHVFLDDAEAERMAEVLGLSLEEFARRYLRRVEGDRVSLIERANHDCVFWADEGGCQVYEARPSQCREFPFWPENLTSPTAWDVPAAYCPGMNRGRLYSQAEVERIAEGKRATRSGPKRPAKRLPSTA